MDPGASDLESSLPQAENPCLIVEDSQPDSVALEDDPDSSYRALLARRLSNLQPPSHSPVLELISSPSKSRCSQSDSQTEKAENSQPNQSSTAAEQSQVFEVCSYSKSKRRDQDDMEAGADSTTHCAQTEEGMSQFGLLELSESQGVFDEAQNRDSGDEVEGTPANLLPTESQKATPQTGLKSSFRPSEVQDGVSRRAEVSSSSPDPQRKEGRQLSVRAILHSQATESIEAEDEEVISSQDDLFDGEKNGSNVDSTVKEPENQQQPTSTPAHSLRLLHLSGQGTLVQESLSQQSVDFVAATQDNLNQTPIIVPNSPTEQDNEQDSDCNEAAESPMDTSGPPEDQAQRKEEEPMDTDPVSKPTASTPVSQNSPGFTLEKSLSLPSQPEFSHDVFVPTPSLESKDCSEGPDTSKRKELQKESTSTSLDVAPKNPSESQPSEVAASFQLGLDNSENCVFEKKTQMFIVEDDSQATQIEEAEGSFGARKSETGPAPSNEKAGKVDTDLGLNKIAGSQQVSQGVDLKSTQTLSEQNEGNPSLQKPLLHSPNEQNLNVSNNVADSPQSKEAQFIPNTPLSQQMGKETLGKSLTADSCSQSVAPAGAPTISAALSVPSQSLSQSVISSVKDAANEGEQGVSSQQRHSQPLSQSLDLESIRKRENEQNLSPKHKVDSIKNTENEQRLSQPTSQSHKRDTNREAEDVADEEDQKMDEGEIQSTSKTEGSFLGLALSQSQVCSPEPMEEEPTASKCDESISIMVVEESPRVSQEIKDRSHPFKSASQPVRGSPKEKFESGVKVTSSQPGTSDQISGQQDTKTTDARPSGGSQGPDMDNAANKSLSDSSGDIPFHFTLPREGELIRAAVNTTPPHIRQLKNTPLHSTPIEMSSFHEPSESDVTRETTMADSKISVEDSREGEEPASEVGDGKLSLRMKVISPAEEGSSGSDHFSLQKPPLSGEESSVSKATTVAKAVSSSPTVFSRVREVNRQRQTEEEESSDLPIRCQSQTVHSIPSSSVDPECSPKRPLEAVRNGTEGLCEAAHQPSHPNGTAALSTPTTPLTEVQPLVINEQETPSTSGQVQPRTPTRQKAVSQQTSFDFTATPSPPSKAKKKAVSQQTSIDAPGPRGLSGGVESVTPTRSQTGPSHHRHVRTIQEVRTTVTRVITDVYYEDGKEVGRKVVEESEEPVVDRCVVDSDISPSRTISSLTSGDLADISSLSSKASSHHSSSGTSSAALGSGRIPDFVIPSSRGAKFGSPRRGGRQQLKASAAVGSELQVAWGSPLVAMSPRGHGRRGRPPSRSPRGGRVGQRGGAHVQAVSSSEEEHVHRSNPRVLGSPQSRSITSRSDSLNTTPSEISSGGSSFVGLRVMAKWSSNSFFYSGTITRDLGENRFRMLFDDNQECEVQGKDILLCDPIPMETEVTALTEEEFFNTGLVKGHKFQDSELMYCVEKDGQSTWYSRTAVILTMEQGNRLREQFGLGPFEPSTPQTMASDISLDNLVEGKRRRRGNGADPGTPTRSATNSPRTPGKRKLGSSTEDEKTPAKRGRRGGGARGGSRFALCNTSGSGAEMPSDPNDLLVTHGPLPESSDLFMGFVFMLTASSENDRESNQLTSDDEEEYVPTAPYNKGYTQQQLEAGGGMILPAFNEEQCKAAYQSLLIADQHCRTRTYLLCVAGGVPCVSQVWVRDCCQEKKLMNYRNYLLPAGLGPEKRVVEWHPRCSPFKALKVLLISEDRVDLWTSMLTMCGSTKVHQHKTNGNSSDVPAEKFDVVVCAHSCPPEILKSAPSASTAVVSLEWLIQSVICGERLAFDGQPEYRHDFSP
ncbi:TP53-binding protein 1-like isoform X1 [Hoplias malabaricus]|uniref:TP53-binding protein 1-like isoform X1 n=1 Tax=Hoplias malabaricus TaxID=27720 RepID=UPI0034625CC8